MASCNIDTLISSACTNRFDCIDQQLYEAIRLQLLCDLTVSGVGGGGGSVTSGHGPPASTPSTSAAIYFDEDTGAQYNWYANSWH